jgi:hypothetical protein
MNTQTKSKDTQIFSAMVEILISSGLGEEDYGLRKWDKFRDSGYTPDTPDTPTDRNATQCLVCGVAVQRKDKKICSSDCVKVYQDHKDAPCDPLFPTIFHQMKYEETLSKINH